MQNDVKSDLSECDVVSDICRNISDDIKYYFWAYPLYHIRVSKNSLRHRYAAAFGGSFAQAPQKSVSNFLQDKHQPMFYVLIDNPPLLNYTVLEACVISECK